MAVRSSELVYGEQLGNGSFGVVFKGKWRYVPVAIKNVRVTRSDYLEDLLQEALLMLELRYETAWLHSNTTGRIQTWCPFSGFAQNPLIMLLLQNISSAGR